MSDTPPLLIQFPRFSREIIDLIVDQLLDDTAALKRCSAVSQSFRAACNRNLFFFITLDSTDKIVRLHGLLTSPVTSHIAQNIRKFKVLYGSGLSEGTLAAGDEWLENAIPLANILRTLSCLATLVWTTPLQIDFSWNVLSSDLRSALVELFRRPRLTTIVIANFSCFPFPDLHDSPVKTLEFVALRLNDIDGKEINLPQLETLTIGAHGYSKAGILLVPKLRKLSYHKRCPITQPCTLVQEAINASAGSLEEFCYSYSSGQSANPISLEGLCCLKFLTLTVGLSTDDLSMDQVLKEWAQSLRATRLLQDHSALKRLTIILELSQEVPFDHYDWQSVYDAQVWKYLDHVLSSIPTLKWVLIDIDFVSSGQRQTPSPSPWERLRVSMPLLYEREILIRNQNQRLRGGGI